MVRIRAGTAWSLPVGNEQSDLALRLACLPGGEPRNDWLRSWHRRPRAIDSAAGFFGYELSWALPFQAWFGAIQMYIQRRKFKMSKLSAKFAAGKKALIARQELAKANGQAISPLMPKRNVPVHGSVYAMGLLMRGELEMTSTAKPRIETSKE